ncbi:transposase [Streptomyces sp. Sce081]|uniref:transposase n=1 Tax=Streptomyces sp. Sce081 TaxID=3349853 RepID=UPI0035F33DA9
MGGDQGTGLSTWLRQRPRLRQQNSSRQAPASRPPAAIGPRRHTLDPHPPRCPARRRPAPAQGRAGQLPELDALAGHVRSFAQTLTQLQGHHLPEWIEAATTADLPSLQRFARHLARDLDAVTAGLSQPWNSGVVEGHVNRIKMLKRQMFGRAGFELLRKRVLLSS